MSASFFQFTQANDAAAATTKKLAKQAILAEYLRGLADDDLRRAVRFAQGRAFSPTEERTLNVGGAIFTDVVLGILKIEPGNFYAAVMQHGEVGEALGRLWPSGQAGAELTLGEVAGTFEELAATGNVAQKKMLLADLLARCATGREAAYLAKIILGDLRTGVAEGVLAAAIGQAFGKSLAEIQRCQLLMGDLDEVAVLARRGELGMAKFRLFHPIQFMLATPQESAAAAAATMDGRAYFAEDKLDGIRAQVHKRGERIAIYTRSMDRIDQSFPDVVETVRKLAGEFLLDGEIVPYRDGVVLPFAHIQKRRGRKRLSGRILRENPAVFIAFDLLYRDGRLLMDEALSRRREALAELVGGGAAGVLSTAVTTLSSAAEIASAFDRSRQARNEGLVLKDPASLYTPGRRGQMWLKLKTHLPTFDCVVTAAEYGHGKRRRTLSDYTFAVWDRDPSEAGATLVNIGKAFSGVTDEQIAQLTELFHKISIAQHGHVHLVEPKIVLEIACDQIQKSPRHSSGYALRFPRIKRIRWDKAPAEADRLARIVEIYQSTHNFGRSVAVETREATLFDGV
jgi:DNA ligase-1